MECKLCGNAMREQLTSFVASDTDPMVKIENVPAHVCTACGEKVFSQSTVETIQRLKENDAGYRRAEVRIYDYSTATQTIESTSTAMD